MLNIGTLKSALLLGVALSLAGCVSKDATAPLHSAEGQDLGRASIRIVDHALKGPQMELVAPDDEIYRGPIGQDEGFAYGIDTDGTPNFGFTKGSRAAAKLVSDSGRVMRCEFRVSSAYLGFSGSGEGLCHGDSGETLDFEF